MGKQGEHIEMKKLMIFTVAALATGNLLSESTWADECTTIQDGTLERSDLTFIETGFDEWGYNYQARMFNGGYCDAYRDAAWCQLYKDDDLVMKWNDAWLSNKSCDGDEILDRHNGFAGYKGSGAWLTNHTKGRYSDDNGKRQRWEYFVKIVAVPEDAHMGGAHLDEDPYSWYTADHTEIGPEIWGPFAIIQSVYNDTGDPTAHGVEYLSPYSAGFGRFSPED